MPLPRQLQAWPTGEVLVSDSGRDRDATNAFSVDGWGAVLESAAQSSSFSWLLRWQAKLNGSWHGRAISALLLLTVAHWSEHVAQAIQVFVLGWPRSQALGGLGLAFPVLVSSEWLHFVDVVMTLGVLVILRPGFIEHSRRAWDVAIALEVWHACEHSLLLIQALTGRRFFGTVDPVSVIQLVAPRLELHLVYNLLVLVPMCWAIWIHCATGTGSVDGCGCTRGFRQLRRELAGVLHVGR